MTRQYTKRGWDEKTHSFRDEGVYMFSIYPGDSRHFTVLRDGAAKTVKVEDDSNFAYKVMKTKIKARGGAEGLFNFINNALCAGFMECYAWQILDSVIDDVMPAV